MLAMHDCSAAENKSDAEKMKAADMIDGKDYITLKRFRLTDRSGFNQPVEASSFLLPADCEALRMMCNGMNKEMHTGNGIRHLYTLHRQTVSMN